MAAQERDIERRLRNLSAAVRRVRIDHLQRVERIQMELAALFGHAAGEHMLVTDALLREAVRWRDVEAQTTEAIWTAAEILDAVRDEIAEVTELHQPEGPMWKYSCPRCQRPDALSQQQLNNGESCGLELCSHGVAWTDPDRHRIFASMRRVLRRGGGSISAAEALQRAISEVKRDGRNDPAE